MPLVAAAALGAWGLTYREFGLLAASAVDVIERADALEAVAAHAALTSWTALPGASSAAAALQVNLSLIAQGVDLSTDPGDAASGRPAVAPVERDLVRLARAAPTDTGAWLRLAAVQWDQGRSASAAQAWQMAALLAPREGGAVASRFPLAIAHWPDLPDDARRVVARDVTLVLEEATLLAAVRARLADVSAEQREAATRDLVDLVGLTSKDAEGLGLTP